VNFTSVGRVLPFYTDNPTIVQWDARRGKYVIYTRALDYNSENQRRIARIETDDPLKPWPYKKTDNDRMFFAKENAVVVLSADQEDDPHSDIYYNAASIYPWASDVHLMFTAQFRHFSPDRNPFIKPAVEGRWEDFGMLEVQLAVSRDGIQWDRPTREPYFPTGLADEWDRWYAVMAPGIVRRGNYLYQYYNSSGRLHDSAVLRSEYADSAKQLGGQRDALVDRDLVVAAFAVAENAVDAGERLRHAHRRHDHLIGSAARLHLEGVVHFRLSVGVRQPIGKAG
jgi:hypothetical protein